MAEPTFPEPTPSTFESSPSPGLDRRSFLKWSAAVGAAAGLSEAVASRETLWAHSGTSLTPLQEASRFLTQCSFGGDLSWIQAVQSAGLESWLDSQMALPVQSIIAEVLDLIESNTFPEEEFVFFDWFWWQRAMTAPDQVRHRVAYSLSQIFVIGRTEDRLYDNSATVAAFYDVLQTHAFGNFRDLLLAVALQPGMGMYLSHLWNRRSDPALNRFPDENFAREVMQLFSIGLFKLNPDGSQQLDGQGQPIPTYGNAEITEMAKIFTGLTLAPGEPGGPIVFGDIGEAEYSYWEPMVMFEAEHEPGSKQLLDGFVVPAGQTGMEDIESAVDHLFNHPNAGPFVGRLLIQRLVTSNPSPAYLSRVSAAFADNGSGVRGDMKAFLKAILLDPEARNDSNIDAPTFGKVREPLVRWIQLGRTFHAHSESGQFRHFGGTLPEEPITGLEGDDLAQYPFFSRSVFNFYSPDHSPTGALATANLVAPELEIIHSYTAVSGANLFHRAVREEEYIEDHGEPTYLELETEIVIVEEQGPNALIDHLDLLLTYGTLSSATRQVMLDAILPLSDEPFEQVQMALLLFSICPEYGVQR